MAMTHKKNRRTRIQPEEVKVYINGEFYMTMPPGLYARWRAEKEANGFNGYIEATAAA